MRVSAKNSAGKRDTQRHRAEKGNRWYFGAKAHIDVDSKESSPRRMHSVATTAASVVDVHMLPGLLHGEERTIWGDAGDQGRGGICDP